MNKNKNIFMRVTEAEQNLIKQYADKENRTVSNFILTIVKKYLKEIEEKNEINKKTIDN